MKNNTRSTATTKPKVSRFNRFVRIAIPLSLLPAVVVIVLAATVDPLYFFFIIPLLPLIFVGLVLTITSAVRAGIRLMTTAGTEKEQAVGIAILLLGIGSVVLILSYFLAS